MRMPFGNPLPVASSVRGAEVAEPAAVQLMITCAVSAKSLSATLRSTARSSDFGRHETARYTLLVDSRTRTDPVDPSKSCMPFPAPPSTCTVNASNGFASLHACSVTLLKARRVPRARSSTSTSLDFFPSAAYLVTDRNPPDGLKLNAVTSGMAITSPVARLRTANELRTGFFSFVSRSRSLGATPTRYANHRESAEKAGESPNGMTMVVSRAPPRTRRSFSSLPRAMEYDSHVPSGESRLAPRDSHFPRSFAVTSGLPCAASGSGTVATRDATATVTASR